MRGLSDVPRDEAAKTLAGETGIIHSVYDFSIVNKRYQYQWRKVRIHNRRNLSAFKKSLEAGIPVVVCNNPNPTHADYEEYIIAAKAAGYIVHVYQLPPPTIQECIANDVYGIGRWGIESKYARWEY